MTAPDEDRQQRIEDAARRIHVLNDQLAVFWAVRSIVTAVAGSKAADFDAIRELYRDFDRKHPNLSEPKPKGAEQ